jgi:hypothetical protein
MGAVRLALPAVLALWFVWKARRNPLFLLGIPVLMVMRGSVFFENAKPFWMPGRFDPVVLLMAWLGVVWAVTVARRSTLDGRRIGLFGSGGVLLEEIPLVVIGVLIAVHTVGSFGGSGDLTDAVSLASSTSYLLVGYLLLRGIACRMTRAETYEFVGAVVVVNTIACGLFVLDQGLHLPIYLGAANITYLYGGQDISRATTYAPVFNLLALAFVLAKERWSVGWLTVLAITLLADLVSLTRTSLIAAVLGLVIGIAARELRQPDSSRVIRRAGAIALGAAVAVLGFSRIAPAYWAVLLQRFREFTSSSSPGRVENWAVRVLHWDLVERVVAKGDLVFGLGFPQPGSNPVDTHVYLWSADMTWLPIMYFFGIFGLVVFGLLLAGFIVRALKLSLRPPELRRELSLTYFITIVLTVVMGFQMWTFMQPSVYPMGLLVFAFAAAEALRPTAEQVVASVPIADPSLAAIGGGQVSARAS